MAKSRKTVAFLPAHPSQIWLLKPVADEVSEFAEVVWIIRSKDCSEALAESLGLNYVILSQASSGLIGNSIELFTNIFRCLLLTRKYDIDLWVTKYGCGNIAAWLLRKKSISFNDDDADIVPFIAWTSYPFAEMTLVPSVTRMGRFSKSAVRYASFHELFYLHPHRFTPDPSIKKELGLSENELFAIVRLSALQTHHDNGIRGIEEALLLKIIAATNGKIKLFITSEKPLASEFEQLRFPLPPDRILHALSYAEFLLGDSQTMTAEAAVLGTPAFRLNDFVGRISYLDELEKYKLAFGYKPGKERELIDKLQEIINLPNRSEVFLKRRELLLRDKIDPVPWVADIINSCLQSKPIFNKNHSINNRQV